MKNKRIKDAEIKKEKEDQSRLRQDIIKRRLEELDKLQKHINEVDMVEMAKNKEKKITSTRL